MFRTFAPQVKSASSNPESSQQVKMHIHPNAVFAGPGMTTETPPKPHWMRLILMVMVLFSGLCTIFAAVVTAAIAWTEHAEARWPQVTARVDQCGLDETPTGEREMYYIRCRLFYEVGAEQNTATVDSVNVPSRAVWQYPPNQIGPLEDWIAEHPPGNAHRRALRSRPPHESCARSDRHAARGTANAEQCKTTESLCGKFRDPVNNRANHTATLRAARRIFLNAAEPVGCQASVAP
jgi:hypothetical protein